MPEATDLDQLRERFPGWNLSTRWVTCASGTDRRLLVASRDHVIIGGWDAPQLAELLTQLDGPPDDDPDPDDIACDVLADKPHLAGVVHSILRAYRSGIMSDATAVAYLRGAK